MIQPRLCGGLTYSLRWLLIDFDERPIHQGICSGDLKTGEQRECSSHQRVCSASVEDSQRGGSEPAVRSPVASYEAATISLARDSFQITIQDLS